MEPSLLLFEVRGVVNENHVEASLRNAPRAAAGRAKATLDNGTRYVALDCVLVEEVPRDAYVTCMPG